MSRLWYLPIMLRRLPLYLCLLLLTQCSKCTQDDPSPQLPAATQTGANTFGCLVNGQVYTPAGRVGLGQNFYVSYDQAFNGGSLVVGTYRATASTRTALSIIAANIRGPGTYSFGPGAGIYGDYSDQNRSVPCDTYYGGDTRTFSRGTLTITRLDGIIAGTFEFTLAKPGCDTLRVTQGRFDGKM
ncbi:MAG: hypothetical protein JWR44_673 [Hymenobacter sp.]|nr:hypothetical protein [Hymenobacter sp.]